MICPACKHEYSPNASTVECGACLMRGSCGLVKCPECGYETPREPGFVGRLMALFTPREARDAHTADQHCLLTTPADGTPAVGAAAAADPASGAATPAGPPSPEDPAAVPAMRDGRPTMASLRKGETAVVERFAEPRHARKFLSLGILPGTGITVLKQYPAIVLRVGYSEFAFDRKLAATVLVRRA